MINIKLSNTFSAIVIIIVASFFLFPNIIASLGLYSFEKKEQYARDVYDAELARRRARIEESILNLHIKDQNLMRCIESTASKYKDVHPMSSGGIDSVVELSRLYCDGKKIASLDGIQGLRNLEYLDVSHNNITSISPLLGMDKLKGLYLEGNVLTDNGVILKMFSLEEASLPDLSSMFCADIVKLTNAAGFNIVNRSLNKFDCVGSRDRVTALIAKKNMGVELTRSEEILLLEYEVNQKKEDYMQKYGSAEIEQM